MKKGARKVLIVVAIMVFLVVVLNRVVRENLADTISVEKGEGETAIITASSGKVITKVLFASYGNPSASNGEFTKGSCHAPSSEDKVKELCLNKESCSVSANVDTFGGDPCYGTLKSLKIKVEVDTPSTSNSTSNSTKELSTFEKIQKWFSSLFSL